jgi:hypothetical protein
MSTFEHSPVETRNILQFIGLLIVFCLIVAYVAFQARFLITGPQIVLEHEPNTQQNERLVTLSGTAFNITHLWLNDRQIFTNEEGYFSEALVLENGYTITTLRAKDRYGRETRVVRSFVYTPASIINN